MVMQEKECKDGWLLLYKLLCNMDKILVYSRCFISLILLWGLKCDNDAGILVVAQVKIWLLLHFGFGLYIWVHCYFIELKTMIVHESGAGWWWR